MQSSVRLVMSFWTAWLGVAEDILRLFLVDLYSGCNACYVLCWRMDVGVFV